MFESLQLADGSGYAPACLNIYSCPADGGPLTLYDFNSGFRSSFNVDDLIAFLGGGDDQLTLATLANGTLFLGADIPHQMRLLRNKVNYGQYAIALSDDI